MGKFLPLEKAVKNIVVDGATIAFAGSGGRASYSFAYELIRQHIQHLTFCSAGTGAVILDLLAGAGVVDRAEIAFTLTNSRNVRRIIEGHRSRRLAIEDYSNLAMSFRFMAAALDLPFMPIRSLRGSDIERRRGFVGDHKIKEVMSPFLSERVALVPPCSPDVVVMHAQEVDEDGNVRIVGPVGSDDWTLKAGKKVIITAEKLIDSKITRKDPNNSFFPGIRVDAVVIVPWGAHPSALPRFYRSDYEFLKELNQRSDSDRSFRKWLDEWVYGTKDHASYVAKLGKTRLQTLKSVTSFKSG